MMVIMSIVNFFFMIVGEFGFIFKVYVFFIINMEIILFIIVRVFVYKGFLRGVRSVKVYGIFVIKFISRVEVFWVIMLVRCVFDWSKRLFFGCKYDIVIIII